MEDEDQREGSRNVEADIRECRKDQLGSTSRDAWSEAVFKIVFPLASAILASVARAICEHFLGG